MSIPHIIHYCWFGGKPLPKSAQKCIHSWKKHFPSWEIREWNESNFDIASHPYTQEAYSQKKWAYLSDYVRLWVVEQYGGIYFDTDVEVIRYPQELIDNYTAWFGFEYPEYVATGLGFAGTPHHPAILAMLKQYDGITQAVGCPELNTRALLRYGLQRDGSRQHILDAEILPSDWLCPYDDLTGKMHKTNNTVSIHWYTKSPQGKGAYYRAKFTRVLHRLFGNDIRQKIRRNK